MKSFLVSGDVWKYPGPAGWHFVYIGTKESETLRKSKGRRVGWGYIPVQATLGKTSWNTTVFPTKEGPYLLAIKGDVRKREGVRERDRVKIRISLV